MSFTVNKNIGTDTPISGVSSLTLERSIPNYGVDWRTKSDEPDEVVVTNMNSPVAFPEKFRVAASDINDIYKGTGISNTLVSPVRGGRNVLVQLTEIWTVTDSADPTYNVALPVSAHVVLKVPNHPAIVANDVVALLGRLVSGLYDSGSEESSRIAAILRGSLKPSDM